MIRLALPKGRNLEPVVAAFRAAGVPLDGIARAGRRLSFALPEAGLEILLLKDWDLPVYVQQGVADCGLVGSDVLGETGPDLLCPGRLRRGRCRLSLIGRGDTPPSPGRTLRLATKYPNLAREYVAGKPWSADVVKLSGSIELAPLLDLADVIVDIVQTGRTLKENTLTELETVLEVAPTLVVNRAAYQRHRDTLNGLSHRLEAAGELE